MKHPFDASGSSRTRLDDICKLSHGHRRHPSSWPTSWHILWWAYFVFKNLLCLSSDVCIFCLSYRLLAGICIYLSITTGYALSWHPSLTWSRWLDSKILIIATTPSLRNQNLLSFFFFFSQGVSVPSIIPWYQFLIFWLLAKEDMLRSSGIQHLHHRDLRLHLQRLTKSNTVVHSHLRGYWGEEYGRGVDLEVEHGRYVYIKFSGCDGCIHGIYTMGILESRFGNQPCWPFLASNRPAWLLKMVSDVRYKGGSTWAWWSDHLVPRLLMILCQAIGSGGSWKDRSAPIQPSVSHTFQYVMFWSYKLFGVLC